MIGPVLQAPNGLRRLEAICEAYLSYVERHVFPGGCYSTSLFAEVNAPTKTVQGAVIAFKRGWIKQLSQLVPGAHRLGERRADVEPARLVFERPVSGSAWRRGVWPAASASSASRTRSRTIPPAGFDVVDLADPSSGPHRSASLVGPPDGSLGRAPSSLIQPA